MDPDCQRRYSSAAVLTLVALACTAQVATAQYREDGRDVILESAGDPETPDYNVTQARLARGFRLFANADAAGAGMGTGDLSYSVDNYSPCDAPLTGFCSWNLHPSRNPLAVTFQFFEVLYYAGAPPSEWLKIREVAPSVANAVGGGYTTLTNFALFRPQHEWGPRDGTLGSLFSGVVSTNDGTCLDNTGFDLGFYPVGLPLLALAECIETWGGGEWRGDRAAPRDAYLREFTSMGPGFAFDFWRIPDSLKVDDPYLGTLILAEYGAVIPGGDGAPKWGGYPLGLVWRFEVFSFLDPSLLGVVFWRATVINRSEDVYGTGIDYDSLYLGFMEGTGGSGVGGGSRFSNYYLPHVSTALFHQSNTQGLGGPCSDSFRIPAGATACTPGGGGGRGYGNGGNAIIVLKSPIGDLRNKLLTRRADGQPCQMVVDPFCDPSHPPAGDTITFNHGHMCGFGGCWASTHNVSDKRSFGMIASQANIVMDGRDPGSLSGSEAFRTFRNFGYPAETGVFNHWVPGRDGTGPPAAEWDFNHDGFPDTLWYDTCHVNGCVTTDWDTLPGGQVNVYGNVGGVLAAGPFALAAGDTTSWFVAFVGQRDSVSTWSAIASAIGTYLKFFPRPRVPPAPRIIANLTSSPGEPSVTLLFDARTENWEDEFLLGLADDMDPAPPGPLGDLVALNTWLPDSLRDRARDNIEVIEIYKSCDGGRTYTGDSDCNGDRTVGTYGETVGTGWRAYGSFFADSVETNLPNRFTDPNVLPGRSYTYVLVAKTRGAEFLVETATGPEVRTFAPAMRSRLAATANAGYAATVYVPISREAGGTAARVEFLARPPNVTAPFDIELTDRVIPGRYRAVFGNHLIVTRDSLPNQAAAVRTTVTIEHVVDASPFGAPVALRREQFTRLSGMLVPVAGSPSTSGAKSVGIGIQLIDEYNDRLGFVIVDGAGAPVFASVELAGLAATPDELLGAEIDPGFFVIADNNDAGAFNPDAHVSLRGDITKQRLGTTRDTVSRATADSLLVRWQPQLSLIASATQTPLGRYQLTWTSDPFGLPNGIVLNMTNPAATAAEFQAALAARPRTTVGATDRATAATLDVEPSLLIPITAPFRIRNISFNRRVEIAMLPRLSNTYMLGTGGDTMTVSIPRDAWVAGDRLTFIEPVLEDSVDANGYIVLDANGQPARVTRRRMTFEQAVLGCARPRSPACNPVAFGSRGATGYLPSSTGDRLLWEYETGFTPDAQYRFEIVGPARGAAITAVTDSALHNIRVVPNPFVLFSQYQASFNNPQVVFTNMPPAGTLRIYTVSGQFASQVVWGPDDLQGAGDLHVPLITREQLQMASGLYVWVVTTSVEPGNTASRALRARGKFVIIQGRAR